jgi:hypothetical protein
VTECTSRQKTELKSGSRLNNIIWKSQVKVDCPKSLDKFIINFHNELDIVSGSFCLNSTCYHYYNILHNHLFPFLIGLMMCIF